MSLTFDEWFAAYFLPAEYDDMDECDRHQWRAALRASWTASMDAEREACAKVAREFVWYEEANCSPDEGNERIARAIEERGMDQFIVGESRPQPASDPVAHTAKEPCRESKGAADPDRGGRPGPTRR